LVVICVSFLFVFTQDTCSVVDCGHNLFSAHQERRNDRRNSQTRTMRSSKSPHNARHKFQPARHSVESEVSIIQAVSGHCVWYLCHRDPGTHTITWWRARAHVLLQYSI